MAKACCYGFCGESPAAFMGPRDCVPGWWKVQAGRGGHGENLETDCGCTLRRGWSSNNYCKMFGKSMSESMLVDHFPWLFPCFVFFHTNNFARLLKVVPQFIPVCLRSEFYTKVNQDLYGLMAGLMAMWSPISGEKLIPKIHGFFHWLIIILPLKHSNPHWLYFTPLGIWMF